MKVVIIGATGATGKEVLDLLIHHDYVDEVVALVRKPLSFSHKKMQQIEVDFDRLEQWSDWVKGDVAISCLGTTLRAAGSKEAQYRVDYTYQYEFSRLAKANAISTFILISSSTANEKSMFFYSKMKGQLEDAVGELSFENVLFLRPGPLVRPDTDRIGEKIGVAVISGLNKIGLFKNMRPLDVKDLAKLIMYYSLSPMSGLHILESKQILDKVKLL